MTEEEVWLNQIEKSERIIARNQKSALFCKKKILLGRGWKIEDDGDIYGYSVYSKGDYVTICEDHAMEKEFNDD